VSTLSGLREVLVTGSQGGSSAAGPRSLICGVKSEQKDVVTFQSTFLWWKWGGGEGGRRWRAVSPLQWAAVTPLTMCIVCLLSRGGGTAGWGVVTVAARVIRVCQALRVLLMYVLLSRLWIQDLKRPIYVIYLCLCCGKMLQLDVSVYLLGFICSCLIFGTTPVLVPI